MTPLFSIGCAACAFNWSSASQVGMRDYDIDGQIYPVICAMGWCRACQTIGLVEILPSSLTVAQIEAQLAQLRERVLPDRWSGRVQAWVRNWTRSRTQQVEEESGLPDLEIARNRQRALWRAMRRRIAPPRCLTCGSVQCAVLPAFSLPFDAAPPVPIGFAHPGCGGQLTVESAGAVAEFGPRALTYDLDGLLIGDEVGVVRAVDLAEVATPETDAALERQRAWDFAMTCAPLLLAGGCAFWGWRGHHGPLWWPLSGLIALVFGMVLRIMVDLETLRAPGRTALQAIATYGAIASLSCAGLAGYWLLGH